MSESTKEGSEVSDGASETSNDGPQPVPTPRSSTPQEFKNPVTFRECFRAFSKFGDSKSDGKSVTLSQSDKWMKQAKIIDGKKITTTDTGIFFKKFKQQKLNITDYEKFLADLCKSKNLNVEEIKRQMGASGAPGITASTASNKVPNAFERLTDTSKYTGSHKLRFDETGKGKGMEGRKDFPDSSGDELMNDIDYVWDDIDVALIQHIIRDPPCRLSFPQGCTFVLIDSKGSNETEENDDTESYSIKINVDIAEETESEVKDVDSIDMMEKNDIVSDIEDKFSEDDEALEYDQGDDEEEDAHESVEEEEDWSNLESDDYYSS